MNSHFIQCQPTLIGLVSTKHINAKATPINDNGYSCHNNNSCRTCLTNRMGSISHHIMPLGINSLRHRHTHTHTHTHACTNTHTNDSHRINFEKPGMRRPAAGAPGLITHVMVVYYKAWLLYYLEYLSVYMIF